jgi:hypothetical protein
MATAFFSAADREFKRIMMQGFAAGLGDQYGSAELEPGFEIFGNGIGLDDMHHIFFQSPFFQRVGRRAGAKLGRLAGFAVEHAVITAEAVFFND